MDPVTFFPITMMSMEILSTISQKTCLDQRKILKGENTFRKQEGPSLG